MILLVITGLLQDKTVRSIADMKFYNCYKDFNTPESIPRIFEMLSNIYQINPAILRQQIYNTSLEFI